VVGYAGGYDNAKDSLKNLIDTKECVINVISEHFVEAANFTSINSPYGISEWAITGLHPASCTTVKASRVKEAIFAIEGKLVETKEFESRATPGKKTGVLAIIEGTRFWAREDAINKDRNLLDPRVLRPISRLGGVSYGRTTEFFELPRPDFEETKKKGELEHLVKPKLDGQ
jgi:flavin reductase (DIM6/NTAB) family NADH-FMN oxidoreductase RutF